MVRCASFVSVLLGVVVLTGCQHAPTSEGSGNPVSLVALIANPTSYDGRRVRTEGVASIARGGSAIYLSREDAEAPALLNGVGLAFTDFELDDETKRLHLKRVFVEGVFRAPTPGDRWSGDIGKISFIYSLDDVAVE